MRETFELIGAEIQAGGAGMLPAGLILTGGGAQLAGVLGALAAIPVAGSLQVIWLDWLRQRRGEEPAGAT